MNDEMKVTMSETRLTEREMLIAQQAAKIAVKEITDGFYKEVGKTFVNRIFIWIGIAIVAFAAGKGWIPIPGVPK